MNNVISDDENYGLIEMATQRALHIIFNDMGIQVQKPFQKVECLLYNYHNFKLAIEIDDLNRTKVTKDCILKIDKALNALSNEVYYDLIPMKYFEGKTHEEIADHFNCDVRTITRQKNKMIDTLSIMLFSDTILRLTLRD